MNIESFREYCLLKKGVTEEFPFDNNTLVFKVMGKIFALTDVEDFGRVNLKVVPEVGAELRDQHASVQPAYHMNKRHWISVMTKQGVSDQLMKSLIDNSYELVVSKLTKSQKLSINT